MTSNLSASLVADIVPGPDSSGAFNLTNANGALYFAAINGTVGQGLYKSDGTAAGTVLVTNKNVPGGQIDDFTPMSGNLFFTGYGQGLWKTDGTEAGTGLVSPAGASQLTPVNGKLFFAGTSGDGTEGQELWVSDGTPAGTTLVKDIYPGTFTNTYKEWVYDGKHKSYFWVTVTGPNTSMPRFLTNLNGTLYFAATDPTYGRELWKSDGTAAGTVMVKDIANGSQSSGPQYLTVVNGVLYFSAAGGLWKSDGTAAGTVLVKNEAAAFLTNVNGTLFFVGTDKQHGSELWKSDGTAAGTALVKDIIPAGTGSFDQITTPELTDVNGRLYFQADDGVHGKEPWTSDGTAAGTVMVQDINPGSGSSANSIFLFANVNGRCYFDAYDPTRGNELWQSDGTAASTVLVQDIYPGSQGSVPTDLTSFNNKLYFFATDPDHGRELWDPPPVVPGGSLLASSFDTNSVLRHGEATGAFVDAFVPAQGGGLRQPTGVVFGPDHNLYVAVGLEADNGTGHRDVLRYNGKSGNFIDDFADGNELQSPRAVLFGTVGGAPAGIFMPIGPSPTGADFGVAPRPQPAARVQHRTAASALSQALLDQVLADSWADLPSNSPGD